MVEADGDIAQGGSESVIALVDDDRNILTTVSIALQAEGFVTRIYTDGHSALKSLVENPPDLAVFDIKMPKMDGLTVLKHIREDEELRRLPVIILTVSKAEEDRLNSYDLGANAYIMKPVGFENFSGAVRTISLFWKLVELP